MQANEAPEKLYLDTTDNPDNVWLRAFRPPFNKPPFNTEIEYTRTDAFIETACEWMSSHLQMQYDGFSSVIKDFRKAVNYPRMNSRACHEQLSP